MVIGYSAATGEGVETLIEHWLDNSPASPVERITEIDYDRYANAEAALAWLNQSLTVTSDTSFDPADWARVLLDHLSVTSADNRWLVGHAKVSLQTDTGLTKLSLTAAGAQPTVDTAAAAAARPPPSVSGG
jgi:hypothetical protein